MRTLVSFSALSNEYIPFWKQSVIHVWRVGTPCLLDIAKGFVSQSICYSSCVLQETSPGFRMVRCACFSNSAIRKLPPPMFPVLWYNLAASALAQACKMLCTKNSLIHWPLVLTKLRSQPTAPFFSACFPSALIHIAFIVALHNSRCVHTHVFLLLMD